MLSNVTLEYLDSYYDILGEMTHAISSAPQENISSAYIYQITPIMHAAVSISQNILKYTTNIRIQNFAEKVFTDLSDIRCSLENIAEDCKNAKNCERDLILYKRRANSIICRMLSRAESAAVTNNLSQNYLSEIKILNTGIIEMSRNLLNFSICAPLYENLLIILKKLNGRF